MRQSPKLRILGITGPIACGKSTVARFTSDLGAIEIIDADDVTHELMSPGTHLTRMIEQKFGSEVVDVAGGVDRIKLGEIVFRDPGAMGRLESLVHPLVRESIQTKLNALGRMGKGGVVTIEAVRFLDSPFADAASAIWLVQCVPEEQRRRLVRDRRLSKFDAARRIDAEPAFDRSRVTSVIVNESTQGRLREAVVEAWKREGLGKAAN